VVFSDDALLNVTAAGPETELHEKLIVLPAGSPSSVAVPARFAAAGNVIIWSGPALTTGGLFVPDGGSTVTTMSSLRDRAPSLAVSRSVYVPAEEKAAVVAADFELLNVTTTGPFTLDHCEVSLLLGRPSSITEPCRFAVAGNVTVWSAPAFTTGGWFFLHLEEVELEEVELLTVITMSWLADNWLSLAVSRNV